MATVAMTREGNMRAIIQHRYGQPAEVLELRDDATKPQVEDDRVLVRVRASSVNAGDWRRVKGSPAFVRLVDGFRKPRSPFVGADAAGVVEAVGASITHVKPGDEVYGLRTGAFAEYVSGRMFVAKPTNLSFEQAAAVPIAAGTALIALTEKGKLKPGQRVLVNGAGGGVGTFTVQIAKALGGEVTAVTSSANVELVRSLGADQVIDYTREDVTRSGQHYDLIADVGGTPSISALRRVLAPGGLLVRVGAGKGWGGPLGGLVEALFRARVLRQPVVSFIANLTREHLLTLREMIEAGKITPVIDRTYPLAEVAAALDYLETERASGKVVIRI